MRSSTGGASGRSLLSTSSPCLAIYVDQSIKGEQVVTILKQLAARHGSPKRVQTDNSSEFASRVFDKWAYEHQVTLDFSRPGRPTDNPFIESFNGSFRDECLNIHWLLSLADAREKIETWRQEYNDFVPTRH
jgi:putative transposase